MYAYPVIRFGTRCCTIVDKEIKTWPNLPIGGKNEINLTIVGLKFRLWKALSYFQEKASPFFRAF